MLYPDGDFINAHVGDTRLYPRILDSDNFRLRFSRLFREEDCLYILFSPGLGYGLDSLLSSPLPAGSRLIIFETDENLQPLYFNLPPQPPPVDPQEVELYRRAGDAFAGLRRKLETVSNVEFCPEADFQRQRLWLGSVLRFPGRQRRVRGVHFCSVAPEARSRYDLLEADAVEAVRQMWRNHSTAVYMAPLWIRNSLRNMTTRSLTGPEDRERPVSRLSRGFDRIIGDRTVMLCGAGPSLDVGLPSLQTLAASTETHCIAAVDTALPALIEAGIVPEMVFMLEGQQANMDDFICSSGFRSLNAAGSTLIHDLWAHHPTVSRVEKQLVFASRFAHSRLMDNLPRDDEQVPPLGSVGVTALYLLLRYSRARVAISGFDFAYPAGRTHAMHTPPHQRLLREHNRLSPAASWGLMPQSGSYVNGQLHSPGSSSSSDRSATASDSAGSPRLISDGLMTAYFDRFCEVIALLGPGRVYIHTHNGLPFPQGLTAGAHSPETRPAAARLRNNENSNGSAESESPGPAADPAAGSAGARDTFVTGPAAGSIGPAVSGPAAILSEHLPAVAGSNASTPDQLALREWMTGQLEDIVKLREILGDMLERFSPEDYCGDNGAARQSAVFDRYWEKALELMERRDWLWRFLPGVREPSYDRTFLSLISGSLGHWENMLNRVLRSSVFVVGPQN